MAHFKAVLFNRETGKSFSGMGFTPEGAFVRAAEQHNAFAQFALTYCPADGVVFSNGLPCGVVFPCSQ